MEGRRKILNGTFEVALRLLAILATCKTAMTIERLSIYSYFALYLSDYQQNESSVHPEIPYRNSSFINGNDVNMNALNLLLTKGLVECDVKSTSLKFKTTDMGSALYEQIDGAYKEKLVESIKKAHKMMKGKSDRYLNDYIYTNLAKWGSEFEYESVLSEIGYEE